MYIKLFSNGFAYIWGPVLAKVVLLHQANGRDFPRNFRQQLVEGLGSLQWSFSSHRNLPEGRQEAMAAAEHATHLAPLKRSPSPRFMMKMCGRGLSIHASISLLGHYWDTRALSGALGVARWLAGARRQERLSVRRLRPSR